MRLLLNMRVVAMVGALAIAAASSAAIAQTPPPGAPPLPPGLTPEIMQMMMTNGPVDPPGLPKGMVPVSGCIPTMGFHYIKPSDTVFGPIYGYYNGKPTFTEMMPTVEQFKTGFNTDDIKALPGFAIDHIDIWYEPNGHPGLSVPHYDVHAWYVPHAEHMKYCNNTSGTRPPWL